MMEDAPQYLVLAAMGAHIGVCAVMYWRARR